MLVVNWVEITDFPNIKDFYNGDIVGWSFLGLGNGAHGGGGLGIPSIPHFRPGSINFWRESDRDSRNFQTLVMSGRMIPNARIVRQGADGDTVTFSNAVYFENLSFQSFNTTTREGKLIDDMVFSYTWIDIAYK